MCCSQFRQNATLLFGLAGLMLASAPPLARCEDPTPSPAAPDAAATPDAPPAPAPLSGFSDSGRFDLYVNEEILASAEFTWNADGSFHNASRLTMAGKSVNWELDINAGSNGLWTEINLERPGSPVVLTRKGGEVAKTADDKTVTMQLKPNTILFENLTPALMTLAVRQYDRKEGGQQTFPALIVPQIVLDVSIEFQDSRERSVDGRDMQVERYTYHLPGVDIELFTDTNHRVLLADVPSQHAAYVREGYESLRTPPDLDENISRPTFAVKEMRGVMIPMRDGVKLSADIFLPEGEGPFPTILVRTPYKKEMAELKGKYYARRGYAFAVQDCRGRFASEGTWVPFVHEADDGYDTIEWLATQEWSSGKIGMIGASYLGWTQWWAAGANPPHLVTIIPNVSPPDPFYNIPYEYGCFFTLGAIWWADILESEATADISGVAMSHIGDKDFHKLLLHLPVLELDEKVLGKKNPYWRDWIAHPTNDEYWAKSNFLDKLDKVRIPVFHQSGWFDGDGIGSKLNYAAMHKHHHPNQKLVLGPWGHTDRATRRLGEHDFGSAAIIDLQRAYLRWFDHWLKGVDNGVEKEPLVSIFVMGSNCWLHGEEYPLAGAKFQNWYLHSDGNANTSKGDGKLSATKPSADSPADHFTYDPQDPTPNPDMPPSSEGEDITSVEARKEFRGDYHHRVTEKRQDILVYESAALEKPMTFAGPIRGVLYASSSGRDTDWFMRLMQVDEEGEVFPLVEGKIRARFRNSMSKPELLEPGEVYAYDIDMWQTGITIPAGARLRVEVASCSFPLFSRNLNTGGHNETETEFVAAKQTVYHDAEHPSHIVLPIIPQEMLVKDETPAASETNKPGDKELAAEAGEQGRAETESRDEAEAEAREKKTEAK